MQKYSYFLGCLTPNRYPGVEAATIKVLKHFGIETVDMKGASCCPAPGVFGSFDLNTWMTIAARNLTIAEENGTDVTMTCNGCYGSLQETYHMLKDPEKKARVNEILKKIGREYKGTSKVKHVIEVLREDIGLEKIKEAVVQSLNGIKVAIHNGCHFLKPSKVRGHGKAERPVIVDEIVEVLGAESVDYKDKMMCCGAGGGVRAAFKEVALNFTQEKVENMLAVGADCIVTPCAFCLFQFDVGQTELNQALKTDYKLPALYLTQLIGLAIGISPDEMGLLDHKTPVQPLLDKILKM
ncbi:MAG: CoB--CoM heterodisulfide reductase subunit B [Candidatus Helarchaeota archaeon]